MSSESIEKFGGSKILIIASYNGPRRWSLPNSELLKLQYKYLNKIKHNLDKIVIVQNKSDVIPEELSLFEHVLHRENLGGSYGAWIDGYRANPGYDWYFFIEDDYVFTLDNFDQLMIDMWDDETSYLCTLIGDGGFGRHASITNGLVSGETMKLIDWGILPTYTDPYGAALQISFSTYLDRAVEGKMMKDISGKYSTPFWQAGLKLISDGPVLISPVQMLEEQND